MKISKDQLTFFKKNGYLHIKNPFNLMDFEIDAMQKDVNYMIDQSKSGAHEMVRVYDDFPHYIDGINIAAIEDPISIMPQKLIDRINEFNLPKLMSNIAEINQYHISLVRFHTTNFFKFQGSWHQDSRNNVEKSILANFYFFKESGFKFLLRDHPLNKIGDEKQINELNTVDGQKDIMFFPGDLCFFDPFIFHKAFSSKKRCHLHVRIDSINENTASVVNKISDYRLTNKIFYQRDRGNLVNNIRASIKRHINLLKYFLPSKKKSNIFL